MFLASAGICRKLDSSSILHAGSPSYEVTLPIFSDSFACDAPSSTTEDSDSAYWNFLLESRDDGRCSAEWDSLMSVVDATPEGGMCDCDLSMAERVAVRKMLDLVNGKFPSFAPSEKLKIFMQHRCRFLQKLAKLSTAISANQQWTKRMQFRAADGLKEHALFLLELEADPHAFQVPEEKKIKDLVMSGGGGKGIIYPMALRVILGDENGAIFDRQQLKLSGASAGGLAAVAAAFDFNDLSAIIENMQRVLDDPAAKTNEYDAMYPSFKAVGGSLFPAMNIVRYIDEETAKAVKKFLLKFLKYSDAEIANQFGLSKEAIGRLHALRNRDLSRMRGSQEDLMVTFADLALLRSVGGDFYDISLTIFDETTCEGIRANATNTPNLPIAVAARCTMALPGMIKFMELPARFLSTNGDGDGVHRLLDGGVYDNIPIDESDGLSSTSRMVLLFDNDGEGKTKIDAASEELHRKKGVDVTDMRRFGMTFPGLPYLQNISYMIANVKKILGAKTSDAVKAIFMKKIARGRYEEFNRETYLRVAQIPVERVKVLHHGTIGTFSVYQTSEQMEALDMLTKIDVQAFIDRYRRSCA